METAEVKRLVAQLVADEEENIKLEEEIELAKGKLSRWVRPGLLAGEMDGPRHRQVWVFTGQGEPIMASESWENYCKMWKLAQPNLEEASLIARLLRICPTGRKALFRETPAILGSVISWIFRAFPVELKRKHHNLFTQLKDRSEDFKNEEMCRKVVEIFVKDHSESKGMADYIEMWHPPQLIEGNFVAFGFDTTTGNFEKFKVTEEYEVSFTVVGPGLAVAKE